MNLKSFQKAILQMHSANYGPFFRPKNPCPLVPKRPTTIHSDTRLPAASLKFSKKKRTNPTGRSKSISRWSVWSINPICRRRRHPRPRIKKPSLFPNLKRDPREREGGRTSKTRENFVNQNILTCCSAGNNLSFLCFSSSSEGFFFLWLTAGCIVLQRVAWLGPDFSAAARNVQWDEGPRALSKM